MAVEIRVPTLGESVTEATVAQWYKKVGDAITADEPLCELETDKVTLEVPAPASGVLTEIVADADAIVEPNALLGMIDETATASAGSAPKAEEPSAPAPKEETKAEEAPAPAHPVPSSERAAPADAPAAPSVQRIAGQAGLDPKDIKGTGPGGRVTKADALQALEKPAAAAPATPAAPAAPRATGEREERVKMTRLRQTIARRLKEAQNTAAILTTFNEVDMTNVMALRKEHKEAFEKKHGVKLGFMSFFAKACVAALKEMPAVNAEIDGTDIIFKNHYDLGIAVGTDKGLVVPVIRDADLMGFAETEAAIAALGLKARDGKLAMDDLQGATFSISNGGVYGSLMSTPILNMPQAAILGMHKIQERPMVIGGEIKIRPMMYLALSYDHRIVDGKEAVTFLVRVKDHLEDPARMLLDL